MQRIALLSLCLTLIGCTKHYQIEFINEPCLIPVEHYDFKLCSDFMVRVDHTIYNIPKGFKTDLASVPRLLWAFYAPQDARTIPAAILHDYMYRFNVNVTRKQADDIFFHALVKGGTSHRTAIKYYLGVRCFGRSSFRP